MTTRIYDLISKLDEASRNFKIHADKRNAKIEAILKTLPVAQMAKIEKAHKMGWGIGQFNTTETGVDAVMCHKALRMTIHADGTYTR